MYEVLTIGDIVIPGGPFLPGPLVLPSQAPGAPPAFPPLVVPPAGSSCKSCSDRVAIVMGVSVAAGALAGALGAWLLMRR